MRRIRNYCTQGDDLTAITRVALEHIGSTRDFYKRAESRNEKLVVAYEEGERKVYGKWASRLQGDDVFLWVETPTECLHEWVFTWPGLLMHQYRCVECSCSATLRRERRRRAKATT